MRLSQRLLASGAALVLGASVLAVPFLPSRTDASSHREAPMTSQDPAADTTDVYVFVSPDRPDTVTLIGNWYPFQEPGGGPNFYRFADDAEYLMHVDNNGDANDDVTYVFKFHTQYTNPNTFLYNTGPIKALDDANWNIRQYYSITRVHGMGQEGETRETLATDLPVPPVSIGPASTPDYDALAMSAVQTLHDGSKVFAGQRDDPFYVDVAAIFDLLTIRPGAPGNKGGGKDTLGGYNVLTIALQVPMSSVTANGQMPTDAKDPNAIIGVWMSTNRPTLTLRQATAVSYSDEMIQVSRLGMPLVNEVVIPAVIKDTFNSLHPTQDAGALSQPDGSIPLVQDPELAKLLKAIYGVDVPPAPRNDLVSVFLTGVDGLNRPANVTPAEMQRINLAIPPSATEHKLGVLGGDLAGFPNGRRLGDDVVDIALRVVAGVLVDGYNKSPNNALGDGVDANDKPLLKEFPYVASPWSGYEQTGQDR